ncbi:MAG: acyl carrier protein [Pseudomonadota bacterium]|nr:acyl carrier protein [Pseudomonadota bacterium]
MSNLEKYIKAFTQTFEITAEETTGLEYQSIEVWDSVGHMGLVAAIEDSFGIMLDPDDLIDLSSFEKGKDILKKYNIEM